MTGWHHTVHKSLAEAGTPPVVIDEWVHDEVDYRVFIETFMPVRGNLNYRVGTEDDLLRFTTRREAEQHAEAVRDAISAVA